MDDRKKREQPDCEKDEKVDRTEEDMQRKAEKDANPLAPPINIRAS